MVFGACSDIGKVRKENEDSFYIPAQNDELKLFLIADGMGGQGHGKLASMMTVDEIIKFIIKNGENIKDKSELMKNAVNNANDLVKRFSEEKMEDVHHGKTIDSGGIMVP